MFTGTKDKELNRSTNGEAFIISKRYEMRTDAAAHAYEFIGLTFNDPVECDFVCSDVVDGYVWSHDVHYEHGHVKGAPSDVLPPCPDKGYPVCPILMLGLTVRLKDE